VAYKIFGQLLDTKHSHCPVGQLEGFRGRDLRGLFVAEYSVGPGVVLDERILAEIRACHLLVLLERRC
jgi:hypothetical protein